MAEERTKEEPNLSKRDLLLLFRSGAQLTIARWLIPTLTATAAGVLAPIAKDRYDGYIRHRALRRHLLFGEASHCHGVPAVNHPFSRHRDSGDLVPPQAEVYAINAVISRLGLAENGMRPVANLGTEILDGSFVFFGGPVANAYSRFILGDGKGSPLLKVAHSGGRAMPPMYFDLGNSLNSREIVETEPGTIHEPAWDLIVEGRRGRASVKNGRQYSDFLVLTSIPNVYSRNGVLTDRIVVVAGAHGAGVRAIDLVLADARRLEQMVAASKSFDGWQALINVEVDPSSGIPYQLAAAETDRIVPIKADFGLIHDRLKGKPFLVDMRSRTQSAKAFH